MPARMVQAISRLMPVPLPMPWKKGAATMVRMPAKKSRAHPLPPVADAEYGPYALIM